MKKILINKADLPLSMKGANDATLPQVALTPCAPPSSYAAPTPVISHEMMNVLFESDEVIVVKSTLTGDVYTISG